MATKKPVKSKPVDYRSEGLKVLHEIAKDTSLDANVRLVAARELACR